MSRLSISDNTEFLVKFTIKDGRVAKPFAFTLFATRMTQSDITARLEEHDNKIKPFLTEVITGWKDQRLVLDDAGAPADFSLDGLDMMLNVMGVAQVVFNSYFKDCGAVSKN